MPDDLFGQTLLAASYAALDGSSAVAFPVSTCSVDAGHDLAEHTAYRRPGADIEPTGLKAKRGRLGVPLFNDIEPGLFPDRYQQLTNLLAQHPIGRLVHPLLGVMEAAVRAWPHEVDPDRRNGLHIDIDWVEHSASASSLLGFSGAVATDAPGTVDQLASDADAAMLLVGVDFIPLGALISAELEFLESEVRTIAEINASLQVMLDPVETNIAAPGFATVSGHAAVVVLERLRAALLRLRTRYLPDQSRVREYVTPVTMADWQVALQVYGDARLATLVRAANALPDYLAIPPGSLLTILPAS